MIEWGYTKRNHNSIRYGRDMLTYQGDDNTKWLTKSVLMPRFQFHPGVC